MSVRPRTHTHTNNSNMPPRRLEDKLAYLPFSRVVVLLIVVPLFASEDETFVELFKYPPGQANSVCISTWDIGRTEDGMKLNDSLVDLFLRCVVC